MFSRLADSIPSSAFTSYSNLDGVKWTISGIILLSLFYIYTILQLTSPPVPPRHGIPEFPYLAQARRLQAARKAQRELEDERHRILLLKSGSFRFLDLPPEISFLWKAGAPCS